MTSRHVMLLLVLATGTASRLAAEPPAPEELASKAALILERNCLQCHRGAGSASRSKFDVRDVNSMVDAGVLLQEDPKSSLIWELAHRGTMPPRSQPQLARLIGADAQTLSDWIAAGAPAFPKPQPRARVTQDSVLTSITADLRKLRDPRQRARQRYFSLVEAHNNAAVTDDTLLLHRAALAKALNSLSWERTIVTPRPLNDSQTLFAIDIEQLGWTREHWKAIRAKYPYAIGYKNLKDQGLQDQDLEIQQLLEHQEPLYLIRADWFVATALQPALYHALLYDLTLPDLKRRKSDPAQPANPKQMTAGDLESFLQVDVLANIARGEQHAMRCGFTPSGVSGQNRLIERHETKYGAYWKSYDFKADNRRAILSQFPLGPNYAGHPNPALVFEHDGGEIIFNLPNGLQGYMLVDGKDRRIDAGPIEVVSDALKTSGSPAIVNGLSCMSCHKSGMINPPADEIRDFARVFGMARDQVDRLYTPRDQFDLKVTEDTERFETALNKTIGSILKSAEGKNRSFNSLPEPVSDVAREYLQEELDLRAIAAELHEPDVNRLQARIAGDDLLQNLGLGILLRPDGKIKRAFWESKQSGTSIMQLTAFSLDYTTPQF